MIQYVTTTVINECRVVVQGYPCANMEILVSMPY